MNLFILFFIAWASAQSNPISFDCGETANTITCSYDTETTTLTISGSGVLSSNKPWMGSDYSATSKIVITATIESIPANAFTGQRWFNPSLEQLLEVQLSSSIKTIGANAFYKCTKLATINLDSVTKIEDTAFENTAFTSVSFGADFESLGSNVFRGCNSLASFAVHENNQKFMAYDNVLFKIENGKKELLVYPPAKQSTEFTFPEGVEIIKQNSISSMSTLTKINLGRDTITLEKEAIKNCDALKTVVFGPKLKNMVYDSLSNCPIETFEVDRCNEMFTSNNGILMTKSIGNIAIVKYPKTKAISAKYEIPAGVHVIYDYAFSSLETLEELTIGNDVYSIHSHAFDGCTNLKKVTINGKINSVGSSVFVNCDNLETVIIGKNVKMIGNNMFAGLSKLATVTIEENSELLTIERNAFQMTAIKSFVVPDKVLYIMDSAFEGCESLESVTIGKNVLTLALYSFTYCIKLKTVTFKTENLLTIDKYAFKHTPLLTSIEIPKTVKIISDGAFEDNTDQPRQSLVVSYKGNQHPSHCAVSAFSTSNVVINVPSDYPELEFCGLNVKKADKDNDPSDNKPKPPTNPSGTNKTIIVSLLCLILCFF